MIFLLNVVFGLLAGYLAFWASSQVGAPRPVAVVIAVLIGIIVFLADFATRVL